MKSLKLVGILGALMLLGVFSAGPVAATHVDPVLVPGNPTCADLGFAFETKIEPVVSGTYPATDDPNGDPGAFVAIDVHLPTFDWESNIVILAVIAKGGNNANVYYYNGPGDPATFEDTGLLFPQGSSHISFCYDDGSIPQGEPLDVSKTAAGASDLKYTWDIDKDVDQTSQTGTPPGTVTFNYTVTVSHDAGVESGFAVTGVITVSNSNAYAVTGVDITDELDDGTICTVTGGADATIPAAGSSNFNYACAPADDSATENTVSISWPDQAGPPALPADDAEFTAAIVWSQTITDECIDVDDTYTGGPDATVCVGDANPTIFNYSRDVDIPQVGCIEVDNTASFVTNDTGSTGSDDVTVTVCSTFEGCTPGFWKQSQHFDSWTAPYDPTDLLGPIFTGEAATLSNKTLVQALNFKGGSTIVGAQEILFRAGVAALLNAASPDVDYKYTEAEVIAAVNAALASGNRATIIAAAADLDMHNNAGCDLS